MFEVRFSICPEDCWACTSSSATLTEFTDTKADMDTAPKEQIPSEERLWPVSPFFSASES